MSQPADTRSYGERGGEDAARQGQRDAHYEEEEAPARVHAQRDQHAHAAMAHAATAIAATAIAATAIAVAAIAVVAIAAGTIDNTVAATTVAA